MTNVLTVDSLTVDYDGVTALEGASLTIAPGEVVGVVGESGSGKTTLVKTILGLLPRSARVSGDVLFDGTVGDELTYIPQNPTASLAPLRTVGAQIVEPLRIHRGLGRGWRDRAADLLESVGIDDPATRARQYPHELSGGMRQRALISSALSTGPALIIADEPTASLDVITQARVLSLIDDLVREHGTSLLLVTHDLGVALERCDRIIVMRGGKVVDEGTPAQLLESGSSEYTRELLGEVWGASRSRGAGAASSDTPALELTDVSKVFGQARSTIAAEGAPGVHHVSLRVQRGHTLALVGESGSGKSTIANLIIGELAADEGTILIDGRTPRELARRDRLGLLRHVQLIPQDSFSSFDPRFSVLEVLDEPLRNFTTLTRRERRARAIELLHLVALPEAVLDRNARTLSGGQAQRVSIARALAVEPQVLLLDEAVSALDVLVRRQVLDLLARLQADLGLSSVFITHDLSVARAIADEVVVLKRGRVVERGAAVDVFDAPQHPYTRELLASIPGAHLADEPHATQTTLTEAALAAS